MLGLAYTALWSVTATVGVRDTKAFCTSRIATTACGVELAYDPMERLRDEPGHALPMPPWYFVGHAWSPCPLVVSIDVAGKAGVFGVGETALCVWLPGRVLPVFVFTKWNSCGAADSGPGNAEPADAMDSR
jgi:hypothetical protein